MSRERASLAARGEVEAGVQILELQDGAGADQAVDVLETGGVVVLPDRPFEISRSERRFLDPAILGKSKNVSYDPNTRALGGVDTAAPALAGDGAEELKALMRRYAERARSLLDELAPRYGPSLQIRRTSFRPGPVSERVLSPRKDDRRLHVDAFPSSPVQGRRILRVFANVNPSGQSRLWEVGEEDFETFARRFLPRARTSAKAAGFRQLLGLTRGRRTAYDQAMLDLHDNAKLDEAYQANAPRRAARFAPGSMWMVYTDSVLHAALAGQHAFEQTFLMPVDGMHEPARSPLRVLERLTGRAMA